MSEHRTERVIEGEPRPDWARRGAAAVAIVGSLLAAIVGMTSDAAPWSTGAGGRSSAPAIVGEVLAVALAAGLCTLLGLIWVSLPRLGTARPRAGIAPHGDELATSLRAGSFVLAGGILVVVVLVLASWFLLDQADQAPMPPIGATPSGDAGAVPPTGAPPPASRAFDWFVVGLAASIAVGLPLALVARRRRRVHDREAAASDAPETVARAVGDSIEQIERDPDARRAIIRAYARMEQAFDDAGIPRRPSEAPLEYLGRALRGLRVSPPAAGRLAALFERARFGRHVFGPETKHDAIGALREIERQMRTPSA